MITKFACFPMPRLVDGRPPILTSGFNLPNHPGYDPKGRNHRGGDFFHEARELHWPLGDGHFGIYPDTPALAVLPGVVVFAELNYESWVNPGEWKKGNREACCTGYVVVIDHGEGLRTATHHLASVCVEPGKRVEAGEMIGIVGGSPNRAGGKPGSPGIHHVHLDTIRVTPAHKDGERFNAQHAGSYCNPKPFLKGAKYVQAGEPWHPPAEILSMIGRLGSFVRQLFG